MRKSNSLRQIASHGFLPFDVVFRREYAITPSAQMRTILPVLISLGGLALFSGALIASPGVASNPIQTSPVPPRFPAPLTYALSAVKPDNLGSWSFYAAAAGETNVANYTPISLGIDAAPNVVLSPTFPQVAPPFLYWSSTDAGANITVRPEGDRNAAGKKGDLIAMWTVPATDLYLVKINVDNIGLDVKGGDGGVLSVSRLGTQETTDSRIIDRVAVPASHLPITGAQGYIMVDAQTGDRIVLRVNAGTDGYADQWKLRYSIARTGPEGYLAQPPVVAQVSAAPLRPDLFFLGTSSDWANSIYAEESMQLMRRYVPQLGAVMVSHQPERISQLPFYRANNIPTLIQTWGPSYEPYLHAKDAFEVSWKGEDLGKPGFPLSGTTHAFAMPHPASREAFERVVRSSVRSGFSGFGFQDMVWMWGAGRGASGYNPATIAAFRTDLQGLDSGLPLMPISGKPTTFKFADYARYYLGGMPTPAVFGLKNWAQYHPITFRANA